MSISLRDRWSTSILHLSAYIARKKNGLLTVHGMRALLNVLLIIGAELLLLIVSLPSYVAAQPVGDSTGTKEYRLRRALTLGVIGTLCIIWILKLALILSLAGFVKTSSTTITETYNQSGNTETLADDVLIAKESVEIAPPSVTKIQNIRGNMAFWGTAPANSIVVFAFTEDIKGGTVSATAPKIYTTEVDGSGRFELWEDASIFHLPKGDYTGSVSAYDPVREMKSAQSHSFSFTVTESLSNSLLYSADTILNILALIVILIGLLMTILVV
jgi:hypothetical protein